MARNPEIDYALILHHLADFDEAKRKDSLDVMFFSVSDATEIFSGSSYDVRARTMASIQTRISVLESVIRRKMERIARDLT